MAEDAVAPKAPVSSRLQQMGFMKRAAKRKAAEQPAEEVLLIAPFIVHVALTQHSQRPSTGAREQTVEELSALQWHPTWSERLHDWFSDIIGIVPARNSSPQYGRVNYKNILVAAQRNQSKISLVNKLIMIVLKAVARCIPSNTWPAPLIEQITSHILHLHIQWPEFTQSEVQYLTDLVLSCWDVGYACWSESKMCAA